MPVPSDKMGRPMIPPQGGSRNPNLSRMLMLLQGQNPSGMPSDPLRALGVHPLQGAAVDARNAGGLPPSPQQAPGFGMLLPSVDQIAAMKRAMPANMKAPMRRPPMGGNPQGMPPRQAPMRGASPGTDVPPMNPSLMRRG